MNISQFFTFDSLVSLITLTVLEIVLGIDNVIFVSIILNKLPKPSQRLTARRVWMLAGIAIRIGLLSLLTALVQNGQKEIIGFTIHSTHYAFAIRDLIMLAGGLFLTYKTVTEIHDNLDVEKQEKAMQPRSNVFMVLLLQIVLVDTVFSFDSIITAVGLAKLVQVMMVAVVIAMIMMFFFSARIANFIQKYPSLKMLALSFLLMVGFSLFFEGLSPIHGSHIDKGYIYFAMAFSFCVEVLNIQLRKRTKAAKEKEKEKKMLDENV